MNNDYAMQQSNNPSTSPSLAPTYAPARPIKVPGEYVPSVLNFVGAFALLAGVVIALFFATASVEEYNLVLNRYITHHPASYNMLAAASLFFGVMWAVMCAAGASVVANLAAIRRHLEATRTH